MINGSDALVLMPTGGGKSLCFQIPALMLPGLTIVVSPLIALMTDQVSALRQNQIPASCYHSGLSEIERKNVISQIKNRSLKMLYLAPETLMTSHMLEMVKSVPVSLIAVDEAHCISVWGNDFRPEYVKLGQLKKYIGSVPTIALTATADSATQDDIIQRLSIPKAKKFVNSFERKNITLRAASGQKRIQKLLAFLQKYNNESGIIYCLSRKSCEKLASKLNQSGYKAGYYHAGLKPDIRKVVQTKFQEDKLRIVCATIAFGMGIDKSNVRYVVHYNMPKNIESYYQEIGRSGRDGLPSETLLFYSWADYQQLKSFVDGIKDENQTFKTVQYAKLDRMWSFSTATSCRMNLILNYFGEFRSEGCGHCDNCLNPPISQNGSILAQKALSAVARSKETMGLNLLIDVLRGSQRKEIYELGLHQIKTYGAGKDIAFLNWKHYITQMLNQGIIRIDYTDKSRIKLTPLSKSVLMGDRELELVRYEDQELTTKKNVRTKSANELLNDDIIQALKYWRASIAEQESIAPYILFSDAVIQSIAHEKPLFPTDLSGIDGMTSVKISKYGTAILKILRDKILTQTHKKVVKGRTYLETLRLFDQGKSPDDIARHRHLHKRTIYGHLAKMIRSGHEIDQERLISVADHEDIQKQWSSMGKPDEIKAVYEALGEQYAYHLVQISLAYATKQTKP